MTREHLENLIRANFSPSHSDEVDQAIKVAAINIWPLIDSQTRITKEYIEKLRKLAEAHKRSMAKQLEYMIDDELDSIAVKKVLEQHK